MPSVTGVDSVTVSPFASTTVTPAAAAAESVDTTTESALVWTVIGSESCPGLAVTSCGLISREARGSSMASALSPSQSASLAAFSFFGLASTPSDSSQMAAWVPAAACSAVSSLAPAASASALRSSTTG